MTELHDLSIAEAARLIATKRLSPIELTEAFLARIAALNTVLHAYIAVTADAALDAASRAAAWRARRRPGR